MPFKLTYTATLSWVGAGAGPMEALSTPTGGALPGGGSTGQAKTFVTNLAVLPVALGAGSGSFPQNQLAAGDITNLLSSMSSDLSTQMNAALGTINGWPGGSP